MSDTKADQSYRGNLDKLIKKIDTARGIDLSQYRRRYLERRIAVRLNTLGLHSYRQYADYLGAHADEYQQLFDVLTINVTDFYRDATVYDVFRKEIVPMIVEEKMRTRHRMIRAWSAGCATGEETYSIAMSLLEGLEMNRREFPLSVFGTDLDKKALTVAKRAEYPIKKLDAIPREHQIKYLDKAEDMFRIRPEVARHVKFRQSNLFSDKPINMVDAIFCRNVFIYFSDEQRAIVLEKFLSALTRGGYLILGRSERLSKTVAERFDLVSGSEHIYRKSKDF